MWVRVVERGLLLDLLVDVDLVEDLPIAAVARYPAGAVGKDSYGLDVEGGYTVCIQVLMLRWAILLEIPINANTAISNVHRPLSCINLIAKEYRGGTLVGMVMEL